MWFRRSSASSTRRPAGDGAVPHRIYNVGNNRPEALTDYVATLERAIGRKAVIEHAPMQPGDVEETWADISALQRDHGFEPKTAITEGIPALRGLVPRPLRRLTAAVAPAGARNRRVAGRLER